MNEIFRSEKQIKDYLDSREVNDSERIATHIFEKYGTIEKGKVRAILDDVLFGESITIKERVIKAVSTTLYSEDLFNKLTKFVNRVRYELFSSSDAPFKTHEQAISWIEKEEKAWFSADVRKKRTRFNEKLHELCSEVEKGNMIGITSIEHKSLPYKKEIINGYDGIWTAHFEHSKILTKLQSESEFISKIFRFSQYDIVKFILYGEKPELIRFDIKKIEGERTSIVITLNSSDVTLEEIKEIYDIYRKELNVKNKKKFSEKQERLLNLINELDDRLKGKSFKEYYNTLLIEWNAKYPDEAYSTYQGIYKAHEGIKKKLKLM